MEIFSAGVGIQMLNSYQNLQGCNKNKIYFNNLKASWNSHPFQHNYSFVTFLPFIQHFDE